MKTVNKTIPDVKETFTYRSIKDTPNNLKQILDMESGIEEIARKIKSLNPKKIYFTGNGSSFHASEYAEFLFNNFVKIPTIAKTSLDYVYYTEGIDLGSVTFIISVSGSKGDATAIAKKACDKGSYVVAITNTPGSELVKMANESFVIPSGKAESFINTKGYMAQLFVIALLVKHLSNDGSENFNRFVSEIYALPDKMRESFKSEPKIRELIALEKDKNILAFSGKGPSKVVSDQTALKLRETAWTIKHSESIPIDEIPHGRLFCLGDEGTLFILMVSGETAKDKVEKVSNLIEKTGAHTIAFCDNCYGFKHQVTLPKTHEYLFSILAQAVAYLWVCYMNDARNLNIDEPRNVAMVDKFLQEKEAGKKA